MSDNGFPWEDSSERCMDKTVRDAAKRYTHGLICGESQSFWEEEHKHQKLQEVLMESDSDSETSEMVEQCVWRRSVSVQQVAREVEIGRSRRERLVFGSDQIRSDSYSLIHKYIYTGKGLLNSSSILHMVH
ncbi:hypothetical protein LINPERHAP1_LOCUS25888 [Linum perenne]